MCYEYCYLHEVLPGVMPISNVSSQILCVVEFKALKSYSRNRYSRSVPITNSFPGNNSEVSGASWDQLIRDEYEGEVSGMGPLPNPLSNALKVTQRCVCVRVWNNDLVMVENDWISVLWTTKSLHLRLI